MAVYTGTGSSGYGTVSVSQPKPVVTADALLATAATMVTHVPSFPNAGLEPSSVTMWSTLAPYIAFLLFSVPLAVVLLGVL
jgi:hypothetical protein